MKLTEYDVNHPYTTTLVSTERITPLGWEAEVRHLVLRLPDTPFDYVEGQSIGVLAPGPHEFGNSHHLRLYSIASPRGGDDGRGDTISICVRRCFSIDDISGERYPGRASHFLCDANPGDAIQITGPYGVQFEVPPNDEANLLMVGAGTGIAPFRAFVKHIYQRHGEWKGQVRLFFGAKTGMEMLYMNDFRKDLALYYDQGSFRAFEAISPRPHYDAPPALDRVLMENSAEIWDMIRDPKTFVYVAGLSDAEKKFELAMEEMAGGKEAWLDLKASLNADGRYAELLYD
jgi:ferredoxin--NADP+ reductase